MKHISLMAAVTCFASACATINNPGQPIASLPPAPMPVYAEGDLYVFSDGFIEEVLQVQGTKLRWALGTGEIEAEKSADFLTPARAWRFQNAAYGFKETSRSQPMWPMQLGQTSTIEGLHSVRHPNRSWVYNETWQCSTTDAERVSVGAGVFDTLVVTCARYSPQRNYWQKRRFNYAPSLKHYVRVIEEFQSATMGGNLRKQRDLVFYQQRQSPQDRAKLHQSLALLPNGQSSSWQVGELSVRLNMLASYQDHLGRVCRDLHLSKSGQVPFDATMCSADGVTWRYTRLRPD